MYLQNALVHLSSLSIPKGCIMEYICNIKSLVVPSSDNFKHSFQLFPMESVEVEYVREESECVRMYYRPYQICVRFFLCIINLKL